MTAQEKNSPELVGNPAGEPKLLQGTLEIPEGLLNSKDPDIKETIDRYFLRFNLWHLLSRSYLMIRSFHSKQNCPAILIILHGLWLSQTYYHGFINPDSNSIVIRIRLSAHGQSSKLERRAMSNQWQKRHPQIEKIIDLNKNLLSEMRRWTWKIIEHIKIGLIALTGMGIYYICDV